MFAVGNQRLWRQPSLVFNIFIELTEQSVEKVLLKFYLQLSNLAVRFSNEDTMTMTPTSVAIPMPERAQYMLYRCGAVVLFIAKVRQDLKVG